jgi:hypothetical protein
MANKAEKYAERQLKAQGLDLYNLAVKAYERGYKSFTTPTEKAALLNPLIHRRLRGIQREEYKWRKAFTEAMVRVATKIG